MFMKYFNISLRQTIHSAISLMNFNAAVYNSLSSAFRQIERLCRVKFVLLLRQLVSGRLVRLDRHVSPLVPTTGLLRCKLTLIMNESGCVGVGVGVWVCVWPDLQFRLAGGRWHG